MVDLANKEEFRGFKDQIKKEVAVLIETAEQSVKAEFNPQIALMQKEHEKMKERFKMIVSRDDFIVSRVL